VLSNREAQSKLTVCSSLGSADPPAEVTMGSISRRTLAALLLSVAVVTAGTVPAQSAVPDIPVLTGIRTGAHPAFDRIVLDVSGPRPQVSSRLVDELTQDGSGNVEWLTGAAFAEVRATPAQAHDEAGHPSFAGPRKFRTSNLTNVMAVSIIGDFEGVVSVGVGMRKQTWVNSLP
jgi:hypothetical protein